MPERITLTQAVIVEGKYDKIRLEAVVDALILPTEGFRIFRDTELRTLIRRLARDCGIVILTDSDAAGFRIRRLVSDLAAGGQVTQVYIPDIFGREKRKRKPGREGKLGVEGMDCHLLRQALEQAGLADTPPRPGAGLTRQDLYEYGLTGGPNSAKLRRSLALGLGLPGRLNTTALLDMLNRMVTREELEQLLLCSSGTDAQEGR